MNQFRKVTAIITQLALVLGLTFAAAQGEANGGRARIKTDEIKEWLTYLSSDDLEGRNTYSEGLGLAAGYIAAQLKSWGVKPGGPNGSYFQRVPVQSIKAVNRSSVTLEVNGESRTFKSGEGVTFPTNAGGKQSLTSADIEFLGYGLSAPDAGHDDYGGRNVKGKVVVFLGGSGPAGLGSAYRRLLGSRSRFATGLPGALATIGPPGGGGRGGPRPEAVSQTGGAATGQPDFTTVERLDRPLAPSVSARDDFLEFLFSGADVKYAELKENATKGGPLPHFTLKNARITFNVDTEYRVLRTQYTRNVIGIVEGSDPKLKDSYVAFGAHYDHVGYAEGEVVTSESGSRRLGARGRVTAGAVEDRIWNGADDDGSGTVGIMAVAKAFASGPKPRRSLIFVWHAGEERGLLGSRHFVDFPTVPLDKIVAQVNIDMIGRNFNNDAAHDNSVFVVGSDRISTELHNVSIDANSALAKPLKLDFTMNDPTDPEQIYYRSDHYSYASKGIPIVFLFTGIHPDYHANTDSVEKINFEKMTRIAQFTYEVGERVGNLDHAPVRDNKGPRVGKARSGKL
jgi:hypothetical protein